VSYLLDTNACLDYLLRRNAELVARTGEMFGRLTVSAITAAELRVGSRTSKDPEADDRIVDVFLTQVSVVPFDEAAAIAYGAIVRRGGMQRGSFDRLIAAHAVALGLTLVTNNERHFRGIQGLIVENWTL
jgi:tRNA(fMet)-specific endonuclease VapC